MKKTTLTLLLVALTGFAFSGSAGGADNVPPAGFTALFDGKQISGWFGWGTKDPRDILAATPKQFAEYKRQSVEGGPVINKPNAKTGVTPAEHINAHWKVDGGELVNDGKGLYLSTEKDYGDIELLVDYKMLPKGDSGIYLRGVPQVQIWDFTENDTHAVELGKTKGSGGLWNNEKGSPGKDPLVLADKPLGEWNHFRILMVGSRVSVWLNEKMVVDHAILENYFDKKTHTPILPRGPIQLQTHGSEIRWKNIFLREIGSDEANKLLAGKDGEGFQPIFNGQDLAGWQGTVDNYEVKDGAIVCKPGKGGNLLTKNEYGDFKARVEFKLPPGGNNGLAIRCPLEGNTAYVGMCELQVLDDNYEKVKGKIDPRQAHGSAYGMVAAARGYQHPIGEWNFEEVTIKGSTINVELNGSVILDCDLSKVDMETVMAKSKHPGVTRTSGFFGFAGHSDPVEFRNVSIKKL